MSDIEVENLEQESTEKKPQQDNQNGSCLSQRIDKSAAVQTNKKQQQVQKQSSSQIPPRPKEFKKWQKMVIYVLRQIGFKQDMKTPYCKHINGCFQSGLLASLKITSIAYLIKSGLALLFSFKKIFSDKTAILNVIFSKDSLKFGLFLGSFVFIFRESFCLMRRILPQQKQKYIPLISGFFAGLISIMFLQKKSRQAYALFLLARAIDITYNSLVRKGILPEFKYFYVLLYSLMMMITGYAFSCEPGCLSPEMNKFYLMFTNETISDMQMRQIWTQRTNNILAKQGIPRQDPLQYMPKLKKFYQSQKK